jgi:hypothetical protein
MILRWPTTFDSLSNPASRASISTNVDVIQAIGPTTSFCCC